jgi:AraC-like DNA-binding protein
MPLYIDYHDLDDFNENTLEQLRQGHKLDLAAQKKYDVEYKHYYISKDNKKAYCVMEGPDKASCEAVHREAHGVVACNIVEVELSQYGAILGIPLSDPDGMNLHADGSIDSGLRTILLINTLPAVCNEFVDKSDLLHSYSQYQNDLTNVLLSYDGREITSGRSETTYAFTSCKGALQCGLSLRKRIADINRRLEGKNIRFEATIVLNAGEPVTSNERFFGDALQLTRRLSHAGRAGDIVISSSANEHLPLATINDRLKVTGLEDERFINDIISILECGMRDDTFNVKELSKQAGISRPQLYRRINDLFDLSPNHLINEMRMKESLNLIHRKFGNISQIAYEVGFNNPSYFAKCFLKRFGILPSFYSMNQPALA